MNVNFCSRDEAVRRHDSGELVDWRVISINDTSLQRPRLVNSIGVHYATFADAPNGDSGAPGLEDLQDIVTFARAAGPDAKILVHCWAGLARSPAVAWVVSYDRQLSAGVGPNVASVAAMANILEGRLGALPNAWVMLLGLMAVHGDFNQALGVLQNFAARPFMSEPLWQRWLLTWKVKMPAIAR